MGIDDNEAVDALVVIIDGVHEDHVELAGLVRVDNKCGFRDEYVLFFPGGV